MFLVVSLVGTAQQRVMPSSEKLKRVEGCVLGVALLAFNILSLTGGLLARRQWFRALKYSAALAIFAFADWLGEVLAWRLLPAEQSGYELPDWHFYIHALYVILVVVTVALASFFVLRNTRNQPTSQPLMIASFCSSLLAIAATYYVFPLAKDRVAIHFRQGGVYLAPRNSEQAWLHGDITFENPTLWGDPSIPVFRGSTKIDGLILFNGRPAEVTVKLYLDSIWRTGTIRTDEAGRFEFYVGLKNPEINRISMHWWLNKPASGGDYLPVLVAPILNYDRSFFDTAHYNQRIIINSGSQASDPDLVIELVDFIEMIWPAFGEMGQVGSPERGAIEWKPIDRASYYKLSFSEYIGTTGSVPHLDLRVESNRISLASLPIRKSNSPPNYYVNVAAFDHEDRFLSASKNAFGEASFKIQGHEIIGAAEAYGK